MLEGHITHTEVRERLITVGIVDTLSRYPVKSMSEEALTTAQVGFNGIAGDRRFAFIQGGNHTKFPWLTARELPQMLLYKPRFVNPDDPDNSQIIVTTPNGQVLDFFSNELLSELQAQLKERYKNQIILPTHLKRAHDNEPISLVTTHGLQLLSDRVGEEVDPRRLRENMIINTDGSEFPDEQSWIGGRLVIGNGDTATTLSITAGDERCMMPNLHPDTAVQDPRILRTIAQRQGKIMGVYANVSKPGGIQIGDEVNLILP